MKQVTASTIVWDPDTEIDHDDTEEVSREIGLVLVGVGMSYYDHADRYAELPKTECLLQEIAEALPSMSTIIVNKPLSELPGQLTNALPNGGINGHPLIVIWSGHGVIVAGGQLRLIVRNTYEPTLNDTYQPAALAELAAGTGADQILFIIDTCHSAAGILPTLEAVQTISDAAMKSEDIWVGVLAASQSYGKARDGALLSHLRDLAGTGPRMAELRSYGVRITNLSVAMNSFTH